MASFGLVIFALGMVSQMLHLTLIVSPTSESDWNDFNEYIVSTFVSVVIIC
jgi:hypothetical protein